MEAMQTEHTEAKQTRPEPGTAYVVQLERAEADTWEDLAEVAVPARSHRKSAISQALRDAGVAPKEGQRFRVLDAEAATVFRSKAKPPTVPSFEFSPDA